MCMMCIMYPIFTPNVDHNLNHTHIIHSTILRPSSTATRAARWIG